MYFSVKSVSLILCYRILTYLSVKGDSNDLTDNLNDTVKTNLTHGNEKTVKIPLFNKKQVSINYDDLMTILEKAPSAYKAFENLTKTYRHYKITETETETSLEEPEVNPYFPQTLPKLTYDSEKNLILFITCFRGQKNRLIDAGEGKLSVQILAPEYDEAFDAEISRFLSGVLQVSRTDIFVKKGYNENERQVMVKAEAISQVNPIYQILTVIEPPTE